MPLRLLILLLLSLPVRAQSDVWEMEPMKYSLTPATDRLARLAEGWEKDPSSLSGRTPLERVRAVLAALQVPEASQVLVFSKTSKQNSLIHPENPRALYFSRDVYCGYVPGGALEVVIQDPRLGPVFYVIDLGNPGGRVRVARETSDCMSCHATARTEKVHGLLVRSVYPDENGSPLLALGSGLTTHETPIPERWGGYYVTGSVALPHLGNRTYTDGQRAEPAVYAWKDLREKIDTSKYLRPTSDIVALMVLEHQCQAHNLLTAARVNYGWAYHLAKGIDPASDPDQGTAGRVAESAAEKIVDWFLFSGEAQQGADGVEGDDEFQKQFQAGIPHAADGESLGEFQLYTRLFKHRCSYMIYSEAFRALPAAVKGRVIAGLRKILESSPGNDRFPDIGLPERQRMARILDETGIW